MAFYAYSPLAGGFLVKSPETITAAKVLRWSPETRVGAMYQKMYNKPSLLAVLSDWAAIAEEAGVSKAALAYRWVAYNSRLRAEDGDGLIIGASSPKQLDNTLETLNDGPLDAHIAEKIEALWEKVKEDAPVDNIRDGL